MYNLAVGTRAQVALEIGTGFGYSSLWLAGAVYETWEETGWVGTIDSMTEGGLGAQGFEFAAWASDRVGLSAIITRKVGWSPQNIDALIGSRSVEIVFIDGGHQGKQPLMDFEGVVPKLHSSAIVVWHDFDERYGVPDAVRAAESVGFFSQVFRSSCGMATSTRDPRRRGMISQAFDFAANMDFLPAAHRAPDRP